jgi:hypothetical protein
VVEIEEPLQVSQVRGLDVAEGGFFLWALPGVPRPSRSAFGGFWVFDLLQRFWI